jgi:peptidoglycan hydrolase FlgJ
MTAIPTPLPPAPAVDSPPQTPDVNPAVLKAAKDFEAMAIGQLLQPMFDTVDTAHDFFGGGAGEETFKPMLVTEMAKRMEEHGGIGLADAVYKQMLSMQEKHR